MEKANNIIDSIIAGIQDRKGENIVVADLSSIEDTICNYFVVCQGGTPNQVLAITESIKDTVRINSHRKPDFVDGTRYAHWVAMDYGEIMVHIFTPELREYYDLEHLWADAKLETIPNIE